MFWIASCTLWILNLPLNKFQYLVLSRVKVRRGIHEQKIFYVLLPYIIYVMQSRRFSHCPAFLSRTAKQRDKKYSVKSPQQYKM